MALFLMVDYLKKLVLKNSKNPDAEMVSDLTQEEILPTLKETIEGFF